MSLKSAVSDERIYSDRLIVDFELPKALFIQHKKMVMFRTLRPCRNGFEMNGSLFVEQLNSELTINQQCFIVVIARFAESRAAWVTPATLVKDQ
ncbi:hypothetical protein MJ579_16510 [Klebsiella pneumoniae]|nr:hypothetical protein MJ579_16510 [Klebsiella pneumoniae]